jgi:hypothetical protein
MQKHTNLVHWCKLIIITCTIILPSLVNGIGKLAHEHNEAELSSKITIIMNSDRVDRYKPSPKGW